jgi:hypothetical protein
VLTLYVLDQPAALTALTSVIDVRFPVRHHQLVIDLSRSISTRRTRGAMPRRTRS